MRTILFILQKEFLQIFRNKAMLPIIFVLPIIQLLILSNAANYEIDNINLFVIDKNMSATSRELIGKFEASSYFTIVNSSFYQKDALAAFEKDKADISIEISRHFERDLRKDQEASLQLIVNAINGSKASLAYNYTQSVISDFNEKLRLEWMNLPIGMKQKNIKVTFSNWFNPELNYKTFMVPGILAMLITMISMFLSSMNIVKEKEIGTIEQLNVTPIKKHHFIIGKLMPFWVLGIVELAIGLVVGKLAFDIPMEGSLLLLFAFVGVYLLVVLGIGLLISTFTETQQQAMFISWFFLVIFLLMSGLFTAIESMPVWAQKMTLFNPVAYMVEVLRLVLLKGSSFIDISRHFLIMTIYAIVINALAVYNYKKVS
jgi:ABC-2 type transport system permease protein